VFVPKRQLQLHAADALYFSSVIELATNSTVSAPSVAEDGSELSMGKRLGWLVGLGGAATRNGLPQEYLAAIELTALRLLSAETASDILAAATELADESVEDGGESGEDGSGKEEGAIAGAPVGGVGGDDDRSGGDGGKAGERWAWRTRLGDAARRAAAEGFEAAAASEGFLRLSEAAAAGLLDHAGLRSSREEDLFEAVARWIRQGRGAPLPPPGGPPTGDSPASDTAGEAASEGGDGGRAVRGESLLRRVRFPLMSRQYLSESAGRAVPEWTGCGPLVDRLVLEALEVHRFANKDAGGGGGGITAAAAAAAAAAGGMRQTPAAAVERRAGVGLAWARHAADLGGGGRRVVAGGTASAVSAGGGWACVGLKEGRVSVWATGGPVPVLRHTLSGHKGWVRAVVVWAGRVVSGSSDKTACPPSPCPLPKLPLSLVLLPVPPLPVSPSTHT
jgi:hypothetical protein